jgi:transposase
MNMHLAITAAGVDIGRDYLDFAIAPTGLCKRFPNTDAGVAKLVALIRRRAVTTLVLEAIGPYSYALLRALRGLDLSVGIVNPQRIRAWRAAEGRPPRTTGWTRRPWRALLSKCLMSTAPSPMKPP